MITTINNKHNKLNVPNKREQNQTCLDSAEREGLRPKGNVPNLRFPEFQGEWISKTIGDIAPLQRGFDLPTGKICNGKIPVVYSNGIMNHHSSYKCVAPGLVTGRSGTIGKFTYIEDGYYWPHNTSLWVTDFHDNNPKFIYYLYQTIHIEQYSTGSGVPTLNRNNVHRHKTFIPKLKEQNKIAAFLSLLDERIATQSKIIDKLQSLIKGMEDNLLDNPLWEKTYLRSFMQFFPTNSLSWEQLSYKEGAIRNLHYGLIHGLQTRGINSASLPMIKNEAVPKQYTLCQVGDVAFADASEDTGEIAKSVEFVDTIEGDTICGLHTIHGRDIKNRTVVGFKGFAFNSRYFHNQIKRLAQGTKVFSITANNLSSCYVYLPDLDTQTVIVRLLKSYEEQLIINRMILKQYEKQKQYLLRQMFI